MHEHWKLYAIPFYCVKLLYFLLKTQFMCFTKSELMKNKFESRIFPSCNACQIFIPYFKIYFCKIHELLSYYEYEPISLSQLVASRLELKYIKYICSES